MFCALVFVVFACLLALPVSAEPLSIGTWQQALADKPPGDPERGGSLYQDRGCAGCHGARGVPDSPLWPVLAGQRALYLYKQLLDYRDGRVGGGESAMMASVAAGLEVSDMADVAAFLSELVRPLPAGRISEPVIVRGDRTRLLPPCEACHGANGQGWDIQPSISGQNRAFLLSVLIRFKQGERSNDINSGMGMIAKHLTEDEINTLVDYYGR